MGGELRDAKKVLGNIDLMILAIKATGGWKERKKFRLSEHEIDQLCAASEPKIRRMAFNLIVAEAMLEEPAPSIHPRWDEYQQRQADMLRELGKNTYEGVMNAQKR